MAVKYASDETKGMPRCHTREMTPEQKTAVLKPLNFLDLPSELRLTIYDLLFYDPNIFALIRSFKEATSRNNKIPRPALLLFRFPLYRSVRAHSMDLALLRTCKQVSEEAAAVIYGKPLFKMRVSKKPHYFFDMTKPKLAQTQFSRIQHLELWIDALRPVPLNAENFDFPGWLKSRLRRRKHCDFFGHLTSLRHLTICLADPVSLNLTAELEGLRECVRYLLEGIPATVNVQWEDLPPTTLNGRPWNIPWDGNVLEQAAIAHAAVRGTAPSLKRIVQAAAGGQ